MWSQWIQEDIWNHSSSIQSNGLENIDKAEGYLSAGIDKVLIKDAGQQSKISCNAPMMVLMTLHECVWKRKMGQFKVTAWRDWGALRYTSSW